VRQFPQSVASSVAGQQNAAFGILPWVWQALCGRAEAGIRAVRTGSASREEPEVIRGV
jgi:hypothetical protein